jgi:hypothetical protein
LIVADDRVGEDFAEGFVQGGGVAAVDGGLAGGVVGQGGVEVDFAEFVGAAG